MTYKVRISRNPKDTNSVNIHEWATLHCKSYAGQGGHRVIRECNDDTNSIDFKFQVDYLFEDEKDVALFLLRWS